MAVIIAAMDRNRLIGVDNDLPWRLSADLQNFKKLTGGNSIIMGRKTWDSLGRPLPNRQNIVISRNPEFSAEGCESATSLEAAVELADRDQTYIIGGAQIYKLALDSCSEMILTHVDTEKTGDAWFPEFNSGEWEMVSEENFAADEKNEHDFKVCRYIRKS